MLQKTYTKQYYEIAVQDLTQDLHFVPCTNLEVLWQTEQLQSVPWKLYLELLVQRPWDNINIPHLTFTFFITAKIVLKMGFSLTTVTTSELSIYLLAGCPVILWGVEKVRELLDSSTEIYSRLPHCHSLKDLIQK